MRYPVVVHHQKGSAYGVTVPDIPGCFSAGDTFDQALTNTVEAIEGHLELLAEDAADIPKAGTAQDHLDTADYAGGIWGFVNVDIAPYLGKTEKINVSLPTALIQRIDKKHKNRSKFLAEAAYQALG